MNLFYLKRSKEELSLAVDLFNDLNDISFNKMISHLTKGMSFIVDFVNGEHIDFSDDLRSFQNLSEKFLDKDFLETYFYLYNFNKKEVKILKNNNILIHGRIVNQVEKEHFKELILKIISYFNNIYEQVENGKI